MDLLNELQDVFKLKKLKIKKQTRKTLLKWAKAVKFEERREKFHEALEPGKVLSKVGIVKQKQRPEWTKSLELLKTKDLRKAIHSFLSELGILEVSPKADLDKFAEKKHWSEVLTLTQDGLKDETDETKQGGAGKFNKRLEKITHLPGQRTLFGAKVANLPQEKAKRMLSKLKGRRKKRRRGVDVIDISGMPQLDGDSDEEDVLPEPQDMREDIDALANWAEQLDRDYKKPFEEQQELIKELKKGQFRSPQKNKGIDRIDLVSPEKPKSPEPLPSSGSGGFGHKFPPLGLPIQTVPEASKCILYDPDEVWCKPVDTEKAPLKKKQNAEIQGLTFQRKRLCERLDLMKLKMKELELNERLWKAFENNRNGDFMSNFSKKDLTTFQKCGKNAVWTPEQIYQLRAVTSCLSKSQELCKNYKETKSRFHDSSVLQSRSYTLANFSYEELETMRRNHGDAWVRRALKNREREPPYSRKQLICDKGLEPPVIIRRPEKPEEKKDKVQPPVVGTGAQGLGIPPDKKIPITAVAGTQKHSSQGSERPPDDGGAPPRPWEMFEPGPPHSDMGIPPSPYPYTPQPAPQPRTPGTRTPAVLPRTQEYRRRERNEPIGPKTPYVPGTPSVYPNRRPLPIAEQKLLSLNCSQISYDIETILRHGTSRLTKPAMDRLRNNMHDIYQFTPPKLQAELKTTFEGIYFDQILPRHNIDRLKRWIYDVCKAKDFDKIRDANCYNIDFLLGCIDGQHEIDYYAWEFLKNEVPKYIRHDDAALAELLEFGHLDANRMETFRKRVFAECTRKDDPDPRGLDLTVDTPRRGALETFETDFQRLANLNDPQRLDFNISPHITGLAEFDEETPILPEASPASVRLLEVPPSAQSSAFTDPLSVPEAPAEKSPEIIAMEQALTALRENERRLRIRNQILDEKEVLLAQQELALQEQQLALDESARAVGTVAQGVGNLEDQRNKLAMEEAHIQQQREELAGERTAIQEAAQLAQQQRAETEARRDADLRNVETAVVERMEQKQADTTETALQQGKQALLLASDAQNITAEAQRNERTALDETRRQLQETAANLEQRERNVEVQELEKPQTPELAPGLEPGTPSVHGGILPGQRSEHGGTTESSISLPSVSTQRAIGKTPSGERENLIRDLVAALVTSNKTEQQEFSAESADTFLNNPHKFQELVGWWVSDGGDAQDAPLIKKVLLETRARPSGREMPPRPMAPGLNLTPVPQRHVTTALPTPLRTPPTRTELTDWGGLNLGTPLPTPEQHYTGRKATSAAIQRLQDMATPISPAHYIPPESPYQAPSGEELLAQPYAGRYLRSQSIQELERLPTSPGASPQIYPGRYLGNQAIQRLEQMPDPRSPQYTQEPESPYQPPSGEELLAQPYTGRYLISKDIERLQQQPDSPALRQGRLPTVAEARVMSPQRGRDETQFGGQRDICDQIRGLLRDISAGKSSVMHTKRLIELLSVLGQSGNTISHSRLVQDVVPNLAPGQQISRYMLGDIQRYVREICDQVQQTSYIGAYKETHEIPEEYDVAMDPQGSFARREPVKHIVFTNDHERIDYERWFKLMRTTESRQLKHLRHAEELAEEYRAQGKIMRGIEKTHPHSVHIVPTVRKIIIPEDRSGQHSDLERLIRHLERRKAINAQSQTKFKEHLFGDGAQEEYLTRSVNTLEEQVNDIQRTIHELQGSPRQQQQESYNLSRAKQQLQKTRSNLQQEKRRNENAKFQLEDLQQQEIELENLMRINSENIEDLKTGIENKRPIRDSHAHIQKGLHSVQKEAIHLAPRQPLHLETEFDPEQHVTQRDINKAMRTPQKVVRDLQQIKKNIEREKRTQESIESRIDVFNTIHFTGQKHEREARSNLASALKAIMNVSGIDQNSMGRLLENVKRVLPSRGIFNMAKTTPKTLRFQENAHHELRKVFQKIRSNHLGNEDIFVLLRVLGQPAAVTQKYWTKYETLHKQVQKTTTAMIKKESLRSKYEHLQRVTSPETGHRLKSLQRRGTRPRRKTPTPTIRRSTLVQQQTPAPKRRIDFAAPTPQYLELGER